MEKQTTGIWSEDRLGYQEIAQTFTKLIQSINDGKVISIEASYGRGKTFFRTEWAKHLRAQGKIVVEFDALAANRASDPLIALIGAMVASVERDQSKYARAAEKARALSGVVGRAALKFTLGRAADELIDGAAAVFKSGTDNSAIENTIDGASEVLSSQAKALINAQLATDQAVQSLPTQMDALRKELVDDDGQLIVMVDELDRCHPEYALSLLESFKQVFNRPRLVFVLMINAEYLENIAAHRFGEAGDGEAYLDKFIDLRLKLAATRESIGAATEELALRLPLKTAYGSGAEFQVPRAAALAGALAKQSNLSFRQIKRALNSVELALLCNADEPVDCALLVWLAITSAIGEKDRLFRQNAVKLFPRGQFTPEKAKQLKELWDKETFRDGQGAYQVKNFLTENCSELDELNIDLAKYLPPLRGRDTYRREFLLIAGLGPRYVPSHQDLLNHVHQFQAEEN
jgi:hypothetical protein